MAGFDVSYSYDATGSITKKSDYANTYYYGDSGNNFTAGPNGVRRVELSSGNAINFNYDPNGNMVSGTVHSGNLSIGYGPHNKPLSIQRDNAQSTFR